MLAILAGSRRERETTGTKSDARRRETQRAPYELTLRGLELLSVLNEVFDASPARVAEEDADAESLGD
jgi:hypothetical protein